MNVLSLIVLLIARILPAPPPAVPNDNRLPAGVLRNGTLDVALDAMLASWRPDLEVDSAVTVMAFAEAGGAPRIPGPLLRAPQGTVVQLTIRNSIPDSTLIVHGLRAGTIADDTLRIAPGTTRSIDFRATKPGTFLYWATSTDRRFGARVGRDSQLTGAIVIDAPDADPDPTERIFVMTLIDIVPDTTRPGSHEEVWEAAINGLSWPHTEQLTYAVGDTVRWRLVNGTNRSHPMHLHGFHFRGLAKGLFDNYVDYPPESRPLAVTEFMPAGSTFRMEWVPTRAGNWLMHCHMAAHITPFPKRSGTVRSHDTHDVAQHALKGMAGLVLGIRAVDRSELPVKAARPTQRLRLFVQQGRADGGKRPIGYVLEREHAPRPDSVAVPGTPIVLTRGVTTAITVINRLPTPTTVHWHGMELESLYDGVAGWSGAQSNLAPLIAPGDSFTVAFTPPRAGTFMYHTHMDEEDHLAAGSYGPILVLEPGEQYDPATDLVFMIGSAIHNGKAAIAISGRHEPEPIDLEAGTQYRLRIAHILPNAPVQVTLRVDSAVAQWRPRAKDGADLPAARAVATRASFRMGVGETYDFDWTPLEAMEAALEVTYNPDRPPLRQVIRVRPPGD